MSTEDENQSYQISSSEDEPNIETAYQTEDMKR